MVKTRKTKFIKNVHEYIFKKGDICCEEDYNRDIIISEIIELYKEIVTILNEEGVTYLEHVDNDIIKFIGYLSTLKENKNSTGVKLWKTMTNKIRKDKKLNEEKMIEVLKEVPLYFLLSFLGQVYHRRNQWRQMFGNTSIKNKTIKNKTVKNIS
jgi:hypothetical protein